MNSFKIYLIRALLPSSGDYDYWNARLFDELQKGRARFGFSSFAGANLTKLQTVVRVSKWTQLREQERDCWANASFMLTVEAGDYLIYFDIPDTDECVIAMATGGYGFSESWNSDQKNGFRHFIPCTFKATLHRNDLWIGHNTAGTLRFSGFWHKVPGSPEFLGFLSDLGCDNGHKKSEEGYSALTSE